MTKKLLMTYILLCLSAVAQAAVVYTTTDFTSPIDFPANAPRVDYDGWQRQTQGSSTLMANAGPLGAGDTALWYQGFANYGLHFLNYVNPAYLGNFPAAGVTAMQFDARHSGTGNDLHLRLYLFDGVTGIGSHAVSLSEVVIPATATTWATYSFSLDPAAFTLAINGDGSAGGGADTVAQLLTQVTQIGFRHDPGGEGATFSDDLTANTALYFDNITLVPEPSLTGLLLGSTALLGAIVFRRKRVSDL
jgi:hypothetical protein